MAKAVPVKVRLFGGNADSDSLRKSLEILHMCVVMEVIQGGKYSEQQRAILLTSMQQKLVQHECGGCFRDNVPEGMGGSSHV